MAPHALKLKIAITAGGAVVGAVLFNVASRLRPELEAWVRQAPQERVRILAIGFTVLVLPVLGFCLYLWCRATRARHPRATRALAVMLALAALTSIALFWRIASAIGARP